MSVLTTGQPRTVIVYELNEVPWRVVDLYTAQRPGSNFAALLACRLAMTTENHDRTLSSRGGPGRHSTHPSHCAPGRGEPNSVYHIPEGMLLAYGHGIQPEAGRAGVDILDVAPSLPANVLGIEPGPAMRGRAALFG